MYNNLTSYKIMNIFNHFLLEKLYKIFLLLIKNVHSLKFFYDNYIENNI